MQTLLICLFIAMALPIIAKAPVAYAMHKLGGYDNRYPRTQQAKLQGFGARARAAHENCFEALVMFAPGVLAVIAVGAIGHTSQLLAIVFVLARIAYLFMYWLDYHLLRSSFWGIGFISSLALVYQAMILVA